MNQAFPNERLSAYIDGDLDADEATRLERALEDDPNLRAEYDSLRGAVDFVRAHGPVDAPADFHARVMARASVLETPPVGLWGRLVKFLRGVPLEGLAVALAAAMVAVILVDQPKTSAPPVPTPDATPVALIPSPDAAIPPAETILPPSAGVGAKVANNAAQPAPVPISDERNDVLDEILGAPAAGRDQDGVALAPTGTPEGATSSPTVERQVGEAMRAAVTLRVKTDDPLILQQLDRLAGSYGGAASDTSGGALSTQRLSQSSRVNVRVRLPADQLTAFQMKARALGQVETVAQQSTNLYGTAPIDVLIEVDYRP